MSFEKLLFTKENKEVKKDREYTLESNEEFLDFKKIEVTKTDDTKPWKPALEVSVLKNDSTAIENLDANTSFFTFRDSKENEITVTAAAAGHIDKLHIKGEDVGSKFDYLSLEKLFKDISKKLPAEVVDNLDVSAFSIDMEKHMGKEGIATMKELESDGILNEKDLSKAEEVSYKVQKLNKHGSEQEKKEFVEEFKKNNPDSKVQFQIIRNKVIVPVVETAKRDTTKLFMVFGPGANEKKTLYTMAPGRNMPKHPILEQHKNEEGELNEETFKESADKWFDTVMLTG